MINKIEISGIVKDIEIKPNYVTFILERKDCNLYCIVRDLKDIFLKYVKMWDEIIVDGEFNIFKSVKDEILPTIVIKDFYFSSFNKGIV